MAQRGGGASGGGGGRSFGGGGGSRSFGGRSGGGNTGRSGGSSGGGIFGGSRPASSSSGGFFGGPARRPTPVHRPVIRPPIYRPPVIIGGPRRGGGGGGCTPLIIVLVLLLIFSFFIFSMATPQAGSASGEVTRSTIKREPLPRGAVTETDYYTDNLGWIGNQTKLLAGMKNFYQKTGIQPYLYLTDRIGNSHNPSEAQVEAFAAATYDALFKDEAHLLVIFLEYNNSYQTWCMGGVQTKSVFDNEARDILLDYIDRYYYEDLEDEEFFSKAFDSAATRMMEVTQSPWVRVWVIVGILAILALLFLWWLRVKKQQNLEAEQTERILNTPLDQFGDTESEDLAKKYEN